MRPLVKRTRPSFFAAAMSTSVSRARPFVSSPRVIGNVRKRVVTRDTFSFLVARDLPCFVLRQSVLVACSGLYLNYLVQNHTPSS
jgi:hypothetical protein